VLVTGALGHYGAQLVRLLAERGWIVLATDMKPPPSDPVATWGQSAVEYTQLDLGEVEAEAEIDRLVSRCDCVLHLGACERDTASDRLHRSGCPDRCLRCRSRHAPVRPPLQVQPRSAAA
jgi:nucleoside-diphosphate-sugar epimerase